MSRKWFRSSVQELEAIFLQHRSGRIILQELNEELSYRSTNRAKALLADVQEQLNALGTSTAPSRSETSPPKTSPRAHWETVPAPIIIPGNAGGGIDQAAHQSTPPRIDTVPLSVLSSPAEQTLSAWTALEVFSPPPFIRPEDLVSGDRSLVASFKDSRLPWKRGEKSRQNYKLYY